MGQTHEAKLIRVVLEAYNATFVRKGKRGTEIWRTPGGQNLIVTVEPGDPRAARNDLRQIINQVGMPPAIVKHLKRHGTLPPHWNPDAESQSDFGLVDNTAVATNHPAISNHSRSFDDTIMAAKLNVALGLGAKVFDEALTPEPEAPENAPMPVDQPQPPSEPEMPVATPQAALEPAITITADAVITAPAVEPIVLANARKTYKELKDKEVEVRRIAQGKLEKAERLMEEAQQAEKQAMDFAAKLSVADDLIKNLENTYQNLGAEIFNRMFSNTMPIPEPPPNPSVAVPERRTRERRTRSAKTSTVESSESQPEPPPAPVTSAADKHEHIVKLVLQVMEDNRTGASFGLIELLRMIQQKTGISNIHHRTMHAVLEKESKRADGRVARTSMGFRIKERKKQ